MIRGQTLPATPTLAITNPRPSVRMLMTVTMTIFSYMMILVVNDDSGGDGDDDGADDDDDADDLMTVCW